MSPQHRAYQDTSHMSPQHRACQGTRHMSPQHRACQGTSHGDTPDEEPPLRQREVLGCVVCMLRTTSGSSFAAAGRSSLHCRRPVTAKGHSRPQHHAAVVGGWRCVRACVRACVRVCKCKPHALVFCAHAPITRTGLLCTVHIMAPIFCDLSCILHPSTLRSRCWVQNTSRIQNEFE